MLNFLKPFYLNLILLCLFCRRRLPIITSLRALKKSPSSLKVCFLSSFPFIYFVLYNQNHPLGFSFLMVFLGMLCFLYLWRNICCMNLRYISLQNLKNTILLFKTLEWMNMWIINFHESNGTSFLVTLFECSFLVCKCYTVYFLTI